jgi:hypothetical protein
MIVTYPLDVRFVEVALYLATLLARGTASFQLTGITRRGICLVDAHLVGIRVRVEEHQFALRAGINISLGVVDELPFPEEGRPMVEVGQW